VDDFRLQAEQAGGDGFVSKPFNMKTNDSILQEYEYPLKFKAITK
jgi:hypothetical protein